MAEDGVAYTTRDGSVVWCAQGRGVLRPRVFPVIVRCMAGERCAEVRCCGFLRTTPRKNTQTDLDGCFGVCMVFCGTQKTLLTANLLLSGGACRPVWRRPQRKVSHGGKMIRWWIGAGLCWLAHGWWLPLLVYGETSARGSKQRSKETTKAEQGQQGNTQKSSAVGVVDGHDPSEPLSFTQFAALWSQGHLYGERMTQLVARSFGEWLGELGGVAWGGSDPAGGSLWLRGGGGGVWRSAWMVCRCCEV